MNRTRLALLTAVVFEFCALRRSGTCTDVDGRERKRKGERLEEREREKEIEQKSDERREERGVKQEE